MNIRLAKSNEIDEIREIIALRIKWFKDRNINQWQSGYLEWVNKEYLNNLIAKQELHVIDGSDEIIGTFALLSEDPECWENGNDGKALYIHHLTTREKYKNLGSDILKYIEEVAKTRGRNLIRLDCSLFNQKLNKYYGNLGFKYVGSFIESEHYVASLMEKEIDSDNIKK